MRRVMVTYKVKADRAADNERYIQAVFAELERTKPAGLRYASFKAADGVSFVHLASIETTDNSNPLTALATFKEFTSTIKERCEQPPTTTELTTVGNYHVL